MRYRNSDGRWSDASVTWIFLRITGVLVAGLVLAHLFIMHYANAPSATSARFVTTRWASAAWRGFDWALLLLALTHGLAGSRGALREATQNAARRTLIDAVFVGLAIVTLAIGTYALTTATAAAHVTARNGLAAALSALLIPLLDVIAGMTYLALAVILGALLLAIVRRRSLEWWQYVGQWAFALHRLTGLGVTAFLLIHVLDIAILPLSPALYDRTVTAYANPFLVPMEILLVGAVIYHSLSGLRLIVMEFLDRRAHVLATPTFAALVVLTIALVLPSVFVIVRAAL